MGGCMGIFVNVPSPCLFAWVCVWKFGPCGISKTFICVIVWTFWLTSFFWDWSNGGMCQRVCLHAISKPGHIVECVGLLACMPILILSTMWNCMFIHTLFLKLVMLWHDCAVLLTFNFWAGHLGVYGLVGPHAVFEPIHMWRCTHVYIMHIHIPTCQSNWKL